MYSRTQESDLSIDNPPFTFMQRMAVWIGRQYAATMASVQHKVADRLTE